jgi:hypothetical protein
MFDLEVEELKQDLVKRINESKLPATALVYILKEILQSATLAMNIKLHCKELLKSKKSQKKTMGQNELNLSYNF